MPNTGCSFTCKPPPSLPRSSVGDECALGECTSLLMSCVFACALCTYLIYTCVTQVGVSSIGELIVWSLAWSSFSSLSTLRDIRVAFEFRQWAPLVGKQLTSQADRCHAFIFHSVTWTSSVTESAPSKDETKTSNSSQCKKHPSPVQVKGTTWFIHMINMHHSMQQER